MPNLNSCLLTSMLEISMSPEEEDEYSLEEKFDAAVKVIRTLPEDGPFQPSDDMMLMFYSYYKQATLGPCSIPRPTGFWDTRGKAKWDAWSALGSMTREEAMKNYVEDIQLILEAIPISSEVTDLVQKLGNFYTEVESNEEDAEESDLNKRPFTRPFANNTDEQPIQPSIQGYGDLWDDIQNVPEPETKDSLTRLSADTEESCRCECSDDDHFDQENEEDDTVEQAWNHDPMRLMAEKRKWRIETRGSNCSSLEPSVSSFTNGTHSSLNSEVEEEELACSVEPVVQYNPCIHFTGRLEDRKVAAGKNIKSPDSDNEEFCDSMEHLAMDECLPTSGQSYERSSDPWFDTVSALNCTNESGVVACHCGSQRPRSLCRAKKNMNEHIATALHRLQHDMDSVLYRLQTLEVLAASRPPSPSLNQLSLATTFQFIRPSWWPLQTSPIAVFFTVFWPVFAHWLVQLCLRRKRRRFP